MTKNTSYRFTVNFPDGSEWTEIIESRIDTVWPFNGFEYKELDSKRYDLWMGDNLTIAEAKELFAAWVAKSNPGVQGIQIKWQRVDLYSK